MEVSRLSISPTTMNLTKLSGKKKNHLRRKLIVEYIQSKPAGEIIRMDELRQVAKLSTRANADAFVNRMIRDGVIGRYKADKPRTYYYSVIGTVRTKKLAAQPERLTIDNHEHTYLDGVCERCGLLQKTIEQPSERPKEQIATNHLLTDYAKQFVWERNSDSLRDFVAYMDGKELELRRLAD